MQAVNHGHRPSRRRSPKGGFFGHGIADPASAPAIGPDRITHVHPQDFGWFVANSRVEHRISLDDGYADNLTTALPVLERYQRPATVFVTTGFIDRSCALLARVAASVACHADWTKPSVAGLLRSASEPRDAYERLRAHLKSLGSHALAEHQAAIARDYRLDIGKLDADYLTVEQLRALDAHPLITIGAHTHSHPDLRSCSNAELRHELFGARKQLEAWLGHPVTELAYPFGDTDWRVRGAAAAAGYARAYVTETANWRSRLPRYGRLDVPRIDLGGEVRRMHRRIERGKAPL